MSGAALPVVRAEQARWFRLGRSGLRAPFATPEDAARALAGVQAQILPAAGLSLWNRCTADAGAAPLAHDEFHRRLFRARTLVKLWGQRGTLHVYAREDWPLVHAALAHKRGWLDRSIEARGGDVKAYRRAVDALAKLLRERGTLGRRELRGEKLAAKLPPEALSSWGGIFVELVRRGEACHAESDGAEGRFAHRELWAPDLVWSPPAAHEAARELARRYLAAFAPATVNDLAYWRGSTMGEARDAVAALGDAVARVRLDSASGPEALVLVQDLPELLAPAPEPAAWPVRLLGRFDPLLLGHRDKSWVVDAARYDRVWRPAGHIEATILVHGRVAGTWRYDRGVRGGVVVTLAPFAPPERAAKDQLARLAAGVAGFFNEPLRAVEFAASRSGQRPRGR